jgi:hypothetical protein
MKAMARVAVWLACAAALVAQEPDRWQSWRYRAPVVAPPGVGLIGVAVPAGVTSRARRGWGDLRVIDQSGREVPFVLIARTGETSVTRASARLLEPSQVAGAYRQVLADTGERGAVHNSLRLHLEATRNLMSWVEVAVGTDLKRWRVVEARAPIYVLREAGLGENTDVRYPDSASRYLRVRVLDGSDTYRITGVDVGLESAAVAERVPVVADLAPTTDRAGNSVWTSSADTSAWPISRVEFEAPPAMFYRHVTVEYGDVGDAWQRAGEGDVLRAPDGTQERAWLAVDVPETWARRWRITVDNRSDAPLDGLQPALLTAVRRVVFRQDPGEAYRLAYGNPRARPPQYDLARVIDRDRLEAAATATLGPEEENAAWIDPSPWTERYDAVLWVALIAAVIVLGAAAVRTLRQ